MRIALISDLHANEISLDAVRADMARVGVDQVVCLGDVATLGPKPREVIGALRDMGCACIMGNHDEFLLEPELIRQYTELPVIVESVDWCRDQVSDEDLAFLRGFARTLEIELDDRSTLLLFHGSPRSHMEDIVGTTPADELDEMLAGRRAAVMAGGHTHVQMLRRHHGMFLANPGSLGLPFKEFVGGKPTIGEGAEYCIVEAVDGRIAVDLRRVPVDATRLHAAVSASALPLGPMLAADYAALAR